MYSKFKMDLRLAQCGGVNRTAIGSAGSIQGTNFSCGKHIYTSSQKFHSVLNFFLLFIPISVGNDSNHSVNSGPSIKVESNKDLSDGHYIPCNIERVPKLGGNMLIPKTGTSEDLITPNGYHGCEQMEKTAGAELTFNNR